jgi:hypothetical protein
MAACGVQNARTTSGGFDIASILLRLNSHMVVLLSLPHESIHKEIVEFTI